MKKPVLFLLIVYVLLFLLLLWMIRTNHVPGTIFCIVLVSLVFFFFVRFSRKGLLPGIKMSLLIGAGIFLRLLFFMTQPDILSDDVYRYYWDGKVQAAGLNPFLYPPESPELDFLEKDLFFERINHKQYNTIYPPVSQFLFLLTFILGGNNYIFLKIIYLLFDLLGLWFLYGVTKKSRGFLIYFFSPLLIIECYVGMHIDIVGITFLTGFLYFFLKKSFTPASVFLLLSVLTKYLSIVLFPLFYFYYGKYLYLESGRERKNLLRTAGKIGGHILFLSSLTLILFFPFLEADFKVFQQLGFYNRYWGFNGYLSEGLKFFMGETFFTLRLFLLGGVMVYSVLKQMTPISAFRLVMTAFLLTSQTVHPWYLLWLLPFAALEPQRGELLWITLVPIVYTVLIKYKALGIWEESLIIKTLEYLPVYIVLILDIKGGRYVQKQKGSRHYSRP